MTTKLSFPAGKMLSDGSKIRPDLRKGAIQITIDADNFTHFIWQVDSVIIDDFIIFPGEFKFSKVIQTKSRVYLLEFGEDRYFYWLQDPDSSRDSFLCDQVNMALGNVPKAEESKKEEGKIDTSALAKMLQSFAKTQTIPDLDEILSADVLKGLCEELKKEKELIELLPEEQRNEESLRENLVSAQLQQAMQVLSGAIRSPGGPAIFASMGLQGFDNAVVGMDPLERFIRAIQAKAESKRKQE